MIVVYCAGTLPKELGQLATLERLSLQVNGLSGKFVDEHLGSPINLQQRRPGKYGHLFNCHDSFNVSDRPMKLGDIVVPQHDH